ncbi:MAG: radical SAM protein [Candidatus Brocadiaceae bacterium]|nr:radical SAM protein [Candidatus Brocadiaceae bacterium]
MKTLLVNPPWYCFQNRSESYIPIGIAYIAGALVNSGHEVRILNGNQVLARYTIDETAETDRAFFHATDQYVKFHDISLPIWKILGEEIVKESPGIIGISMWSGSYQSTINTCKVIKAQNPHILTVVGGIHPTLDPLSVIKHPEIDFVICGEGERAVVELWPLLEEGGDIYRKAISIQGIWTKINGEIHNGGKTTLTDLIDEIPFPNYEVVIGDPSASIAGIMTARGCPYGCTFCASKDIWGRSVRFRSVDSCIRELSLYREKFGLKWFRVNDDSFCLRKERVLEFCDKLVERFGHTWWFGIDANVNTLNQEIIDKLEWAGCTEISIGLESVAPRIQKFCRKKVDLNRAREIISCINRSKIASGVYFMTGFPHETEEELEENIKFMKEVKPQNSIWGIVTPYPGTELYQYAIKEGFLPDVDPIHLMHHSLKTSMADIPMKRYEEILCRILRIQDEIALTYQRRHNWYGLRPHLFRFGRLRRCFKKLVEKLGI